jgi:hypothetical protein
VCCSRSQQEPGAACAVASAEIAPETCVCQAGLLLHLLCPRHQLCAIGHTLFVALTVVCSHLVNDARCVTSCVHGAALDFAFYRSVEQHPVC